MPSHYFHHIAIDKHGNRLTFIAGASSDPRENTNLASGPFCSFDPQLCILNMQDKDIRHIYGEYLFRTLSPSEMGRNAADTLHKALCRGVIRLTRDESPSERRKANARARQHIQQALSNIVFQTNTNASFDHITSVSESTKKHVLDYVGLLTYKASQSTTERIQWLEEANKNLNPIKQLYTEFEAALQTNTIKEFTYRLTEEQRTPCVQALGLDSTRIDLALFKQALTFLAALCQDLDLKQLIQDFCIAYVKATRRISYTRVDDSAIFEVMLTTVLVTFTPKAADANSQIKRIVTLGKLLTGYAQHNPWQEQRHNKPAGTYSLADAQTESAKLFNITNPAKQKITCPIINVPCFNVVKTKSAKKNAKRLIEENYPEGSANLTPKSYLQQELDRQLADQEAALNEMSVAEYLEGRELFTNNKRGNKSTQSARDRFREDLIDDGQEKFQNDPNLSKAEIKAKATERADRIIQHLAALHNPDQVVGGKDKIDADSFGLTNVNSSIGTQWIKGGKEQPTQLSRVATIDEGAQTVAENQRHKTKMNVRLTRCSDDNTCNI